MTLSRIQRLFHASLNFSNRAWNKSLYFYDGLCFLLSFLSLLVPLFSIMEFLFLNQLDKRDWLIPYYIVRPLGDSREWVFLETREMWFPATDTSDFFFFFFLQVHPPFAFQSCTEGNWQHLLQQDQHFGFCLVGRF